MNQLNFNNNSLLRNRINIQDRVRGLQHEPRENARLEIEQLRQNLTAQFLLLQSLQIPLQDIVNSDGPSSDEDTLETFDDLDNEEVGPDSQSTQEYTSDLLPPERRPVILPSTHMPNATILRKSELRLRIKQASQYLTALREAIAEKSFQYSHVMRVAPSKGVRTRSRATISKINDRISNCSRMYSRARAAIVRLSPDDRSLNKYQVLQKADVKSSTAILDPNSPGSSSLRLSWIWQKHSGSAQSAPESMLECKSKPKCSGHTYDCFSTVQRVHWLRARAQNHRWQEELILVKHEMEWTTRYFVHRARVWIDRITPSQKPGPNAYAARQRAQWMQLADDADRLFRVVNIDYTSLVVT